MFKLFVLLIAISGISATIPPYIKVCTTGDKNEKQISKCIINSVNELKPILAKGIPELNVPSLEPLKLDEIKLRSGPSSAKINANLTNLMVWGPTSFEVLELKVNLAKNRFLFRINIPHLHFKGDYDIDMNVLILKYKGQGPITGNFTNMLGNVILRGHIENIDGKKHLQFDKFDIKLIIQKSQIYLEGLFEQDPNIGRATNNVINDNSDVFIEQIKPALETSLEDKFKEVANSICKRFTYDELFPVQ